MHSISAPAFHVVLVAPEIPQNTGTIARMTAATSCHLHLIEPLGFSLEDKYLKRAGLDYWPEVTFFRYSGWDEFVETLKPEPERMWFFTTHSSRIYTQAQFGVGDYFVFGSESRGLPAPLHEKYENQRLRIPIDNPKVRSLNLSNAASIVVYEARRQLEFIATTT